VSRPGSVPACPETRTTTISCRWSVLPPELAHGQSARFQAEHHQARDGLALILVFGGLFAALLVFSLLNVASISASDLWASAGLGVFLLLLALLGVAGLRTYFALDGDTIEFVRPFATRRFHVSELGGFGVLQMTVNGVPLLFFLLYGFGPKQVARIPVNLGQRTEVEQWFLIRLPIVVDDGPKPQYHDARGRDRDPTFKP
jgi:hypothetical protein